MRTLSILLQAASTDNKGSILIVLIVIGIAVALFFLYRDFKKGMQDNSLNQNTRYPALKAIAGVYKGVAYIIGLIAGLTTAYLYGRKSTSNTACHNQFSSWSIINLGITCNFRIYCCFN